ncbi:MAG: hypothetical protein KDD47_14185, partial [Acidobacteria bacterium]|nr:hypothetical protein [Acidobacteriota bacterium]
MQELNDLRGELPGHGLTYLAEIPYVYHCHHFNLFHDQCIEDALGEDAAIELKVHAAQDAFRDLLSSLCKATGATTPAARIELATSVFKFMGQGKLNILCDASGGEARGDFLHYSFAWMEKYGAKVKRLDPTDAVAAGYAAAAVEVAYSLSPGALTAVETGCFAMREPSCSFRLSVREPLGAPVPMRRSLQALNVGKDVTGQDGDRIAKITAGLREFLRGVAGDERGLIQAFNVFVTMHSPTYYNRTAYETLHRLEESGSPAVAAAEALFGESGHVCVFNTFGNLLLSPEWEALVGPLSGEVEDTVSFCCAIARALGFGNWVIGELIPGERLVLQASATYEAPFYLARYGQSEKP